MIHKRHLSREMDFLTLETDTRVTSRSSRNFGSNLNSEKDKPATQCRESLFCTCNLMATLNLNVSPFQDLEALVVSVHKQLAIISTSTKTQKFILFK